MSVEDMSRNKCFFPRIPQLYSEDTPYNPLMPRVYCLRREQELTTREPYICPEQAQMEKPALMQTKKTRFAGKPLKLNDRNANNYGDLYQSSKSESESKSKSKSPCDWRSVSQSVSLGVELHLGLMIWYLLLFDSYGPFFFCGAPYLTIRRVCLLYMLLVLASAVFPGPSPMVLVTIFYCLRFETSLFVAYYDSQGHGGGIRPRLHTGVYQNWVWVLRYDRRSAGQSVLE
jgi:hypothetical protein